MTTKSPPEITVFEIADWFLARAKSEDKPLRHMKLQKLIYFAYGWYCAYYDGAPLFAEEIYAWQRGAVVKVLYEKYRVCGDNPIIAENLVCPDLDENVTEILESVWKSYFPLTDFLLGKAIRRHPAWRKSQRAFVGWDAVMLPETIRESFKEMARVYENVHT